MPINKLIKGHLEFKEKLFDLHENEFVSLVHEGQSPKALFISCSDSRVVPDLIMQCNPGDLFHHRTVGNFIPEYSEDPVGIHTSALAAVEYAINVLNVEDIIICGHSNCGACAGIYQDLDDPQLVHLKHWITQNSKLAKFAAIEKSSGINEKTAEKTEKISLLYQIENLTAYPIVKQNMEKGKLHVHAWYYNISNGEIEYFDTDKLAFVNIKESKESK